MLSRIVVIYFVFVHALYNTIIMHDTRLSSARLTGTAMNEPSENISTRYRIGAVARLTGISPDTLRIWEQRYTAVSPQRSPRGGRLYSTGEMERLRLMKQLVDAGDAIGEVSGLDTETLQGRLQEAHRLPPLTASMRMSPLSGGCHG